jgi:hypothetical protein
VSGTPVVFLFDTTHHVLWAEEIAVTAGIPADVVPAPPDRGEARCDLALETFADRAEELVRSLDREGVEFHAPDGVRRTVPGDD